MEAVFFYIFAVASVVGAILVISHRNPVVSAVSLVLTLFSTAVLFVLLLAHFVAAIQILVYAGAIMVLFVFTVMFLNLSADSLSFDAQNIPIKLGILFIILIGVGVFATFGFKDSFPLQHGQTLSPETFGSVEGVGEVLFSNFLLPFELTSVLIVVAILGVVAIAKRRID